MSNQKLESLGQRPTIITLFSILTITFCVIMIVLAIVPEDVFNGDDAGTSPPRDMTFRIVDIVIALIKVGGAIFLLQMKKMGFYLYTFGEILYVGSLIYVTKQQLDFYDGMIFPADLQLDPTIFITITAAVLIVGSIIWISVYASKLKDMT